MAPHESRTLASEDRSQIDHTDHNEREFTTRAVVAGALLGVLIMTQNVYLGLKTGITEAGSLLSSILCFAVFKSLRQNISILENNIAQSISTAAGSIGIIVSVIPALQLVGFHLSSIQIFFWMLAVACLGLFFAIPLRRQLIEQETLPFPTGTATATTIRAMHVHGDNASRKAKTLGIVALLSGIITWFRDAIPTIIPALNSFPMMIRSYQLEQLSLGVYSSPLMLSVGLLIGIRVGLSLLLGALICWGVLGPWLAEAQIIERVGHRAITHWTMWPAIALMVGSGFTSLALKGGMIARSLRSMRSTSFGEKNSAELPFGIWLGGLVVTAIAVIVLLQWFLHVSILVAVVGIFIAFILATVAIRGYGETDINPVGTMGHASQIATSMMAHGQQVTTLASGGVTAGCSDVSAGLMQVFKTGHLLGATPRRQVIGQFIGVVVGALTAVLIYSALTSTNEIGSETIPAPGAMPWSGMAKLLSEGTSTLPTHGGIAILLGATAGILFTLAERTKLRRFVPSPFGMGIGMVVPGFISITIFLGSLVGMILEKRAPKWSDTYLTSVASGGIAGEAITGVVISILTVLGILVIE